MSTMGESAADGFLTFEVSDRQSVYRSGLRTPFSFAAIIHANLELLGQYGVSRIFPVEGEISTALS